MKLYFLVGLLSLFFTLTAQKKISDRVTGADDGTPIKGVQISVPGTEVYCLTDSFGNYELMFFENVDKKRKIKAEVTSVLLFSSKHIKENPYIPVLIELEDRSVIDVALLLKGARWSHSREIMPARRVLRLERKSP